MTRISENNVYQNIQDNLLYRALNAKENITSIIPSTEKNYSEPTNNLEVLLTNRETNISELGKIFNPNHKDTDQIYNFLKNCLPKDKVLKYTKKDINDILDIDTNIVTCIENSFKKIIGINIAYPAIYVPQVAKKEGWYQEGGFNSEYFNKESIYAELCTVDLKYRCNGIGNVLMSKLILDSANRKFNQILGYSVPKSYQHHLNFGFKKLGIAILKFIKDNEITETYLIKLNINKKKLFESKKMINNILIN